ncbi:MAG: hypothetical protein AB7G08_26430 [Hyphomicrobiaceae bacterium]
MQFWNAYPSGKRAHTKRTAARKAFAAILAGTHREGHKATTADYVPIACNWLNAARWLDAPQLAKGYGSKANDLWSNPHWSGPTVHDTGENFAQYTQRMIAEGKYRPNGSTQ